jgi:rubrerythrin
MLNAIDARLLIADEDEAIRTAYLRAAVQRDGRCSRCGYGIAVNPPPERCPMCNTTADWSYMRDATYGVIG